MSSAHEICLAARTICSQAVFHSHFPTIRNSCMPAQVTFQCTCTCADDVTGVADETLFTFSCAGWLEWNNDATAPDLRFEYKIAELGMQRFVLFDYNYNVSVTSVHNEHGVTCQQKCVSLRGFVPCSDRTCCTTAARLRARRRCCPWETQTLISSTRPDSTSMTREATSSPSCRTLRYEIRPEFG